MRWVQLLRVPAFHTKVKALDFLLSQRHAGYNLFSSYNNLFSTGRLIVQRWVVVKMCSVSCFLKQLATFSTSLEQRRVVSLLRVAILTPQFTSVPDTEVLCLFMS